MPYSAALAAAVILSLPAAAEEGLSSVQRQKAADALESALEANRRDRDASSSLGRLHAATLHTAAMLGPDSRLGAKLLAEIVSTRKEDLKTRLEELTKLTRAVRDALAFRPIQSADRPNGFPAFTTVGEIELKSYPRYRLARAAMGQERGTTSAFWTLFQHIKKNEIAMTAPVETSYEKRKGKAPSESSMAFLYGDSKLGQAGKEGDVEVVDIAPKTVISLGARGYDRDRRVAEYERELEAWIARHPRWRRAGATRVMGWNGPSVMGSKRYFEVQIPLAPRRSIPKKMSASLEKGETKQEERRRGESGSKSRDA